MPIPLLAVALFKVAATAISLYEVYSALSDIFEEIDDYLEDLDKAKEELKSYFEAIKEEIDDNIEARGEVAVLESLYDIDHEKRSKTIIKNRGSRSSNEIKTAILQGIPYRKVISEICRAADNMPVLQLKRKDSRNREISLKDAVKAKSALLKEFLGYSFEAVAEKNLEDYIVVKQKQLAAALVFEFLDSGLDWKSPLKTEVSFGPGSRSSNRRNPSFIPFEDPKIEENEVTKLERSKNPLNPFFPAPYMARGSISADLVIPDYRKEPVSKRNLFAIIEIKFPNDQIKPAQMKAYGKLISESKKDKDKYAIGKYNDKHVSSGGKLALFRYPEDAAHAENEKEGGRKQNTRRGKLVPPISGKN